MIRALVLSVVLSLPAAALAQDAKVAKEIDQKLRTLKLDIDFKDTPVAQFADYLAEIASINVVVDAAVRESDVKVTLKVTNVSARSILNLALGPHKLGFGVRDGVLRIAKEEEFQKDVKLYLVDVRDLLYPIQDFPGVEITLQDSGLQTSAGGDATSSPELPIVDLIKAHTGGKTWDDNPRASINLNNGLLVMKQTPEVYKQVLRIIDQLRRNK